MGLKVAESPFGLFIAVMVILAQLIASWVNQSA